MVLKQIGQDIFRDKTKKLHFSLSNNVVLGREKNNKNKNIQAKIKATFPQGKCRPSLTGYRAIEHYTDGGNLYIDR